ncbi:MAG: hypothetical protein ACOYBQ_02945 [Fluviibacter sp.]
MAYATLAARRSINGNSPLRAFSVTLTEAGTTPQRRTFTTLAKSSSEALRNALTLPNLALPVGATVKPVGLMADANRVFALKMALADLVD